MIYKGFARGLLELDACFDWLKFPVLWLSTSFYSAKHIAGYGKKRKKERKKLLLLAQYKSWYVTWHCVTSTRRYSVTILVLRGRAPFGQRQESRPLVLFSEHGKRIHFVLSAILVPRASVSCGHVVGETEEKKRKEKKSWKCWQWETSSLLAIYMFFFQQILVCLFSFISIVLTFLIRY